MALTTWVECRVWEGSRSSKKSPSSTKTGRELSSPCNGQPDFEDFTVPDEFRHSIERMNTVHYLSSRYYEHWLCGMELLLVEKGIVSKQELDERTSKFKQGVGTIPRREYPI